MNAPFTASPAYGRDYKSKKELLADWNADKDFRARSFNGETYVNRAQAIEQKYTSVQVRWKRDTQVAVIKPGKDGIWK